MSGCCASRSGLRLNITLFPEEQNEIDENGNGDEGRYKPYVHPLLLTIDCIVVRRQAGEPRADKHAYPIRCERKQTLCSVLYLLARFLFCIHIAGDEEEVITDAVKYDAGI